MSWFQFTEPVIPLKKRLSITDLLIGVAVSAIYFGTAKLGLRMDAVSGFATLIWPPSGIAFAAIFLLGYRFWPAIVLGAFLINYMIGAPFWSAWGVAAGNTMEAVTAVWLLKKFTDFHGSLDRIKDVFWFLVLAAGASTLVSATVGVSSLALSHAKSFEGFGVTWAAWWAGDAMGDIVVAPIILVWATVFRKPRFNFWRLLETLLLVLILSTICFLVFEKQLRLAFLIFPMVVWAALRFGQRGTLATVFAVSVVFVWGVMNGHGPFKGGTLRENLYVLLSFLTVSSTTGMILAASVAERKKAIKSRDEFLSITSHELKTPITTLSIHIEKTEMEIDVEKNLAPSPKVLAEVFAILMNQINRLGNLVDNLLDVSRIDAGKLGFSFKEMDLSKLLAETVHQFSKELVKFQCDLKMDVQENIIIEGDATRLEQVVVNLLSNITKHAPGSAVKISLRKEGLVAKLVVEDRGPGIPKNLQARIFERYERGMASHAVPGMGLGLLIVKELVKGHHGSIDLESEVGAGVKLTIQLPLKG
jgi:signal transduction histidine kinase